MQIFCALIKQLTQPLKHLSIITFACCLVFTTAAIGDDRGSDSTSNEAGSADSKSDGENKSKPVDSEKPESKSTPKPKVTVKKVPPKDSDSDRLTDLSDTSTLDEMIGRGSISTPEKLMLSTNYLLRPVKHNPIQVIQAIHDLNHNSIVLANMSAISLHDSYYEEVLEELIKRLRFEVEDPRHGDMNQARLIYIQNVLMTIVKLIEGKGNVEYDVFSDIMNIAMRDIEGIKDKYSLVHHDDLKIAHAEFIKNNNLPAEIAKHTHILFIAARNAIASRENAFPSVTVELNKHDGVPEEYKRIYSPTPERPDADPKELDRLFDEAGFLNKSSFAQDKKNVERIKTYLEKNVIDQPEVIEHVLGIERKKALRVTQKPNVFATIGLPGTGKDTFAEAYVQAMHPTDKEAVDKYMYRIKIAKDKSEIWSELGSATGFVGSDQEPKLIKWLVEVSGGKYIMEQTMTMSGPAHKVIKNPAWQGKPLPGTVAPDKAILYINEFHNWSYDAKDDPLKEFLEKGIFRINNPNGGETLIQVPVTTQIASNNGIDLLADRYEDGRPRGSKSQTYDELMKRWKAVKDNYRLLKSAIMRGDGGSGESGIQGMGSNKKGTSEETANRIQHIFLLRPISAEGLQKIITLKMDNLQKSYMSMNESIGKVEITWTDNLIQKLQEYQFNAEEGARPLDTKIENFIEKTLDELIYEEVIAPKGDKVVAELDMVEAKDGTYELIARVTDAASKETIVTETIKASEATKYNEPLTESEIDKLLNFEKEVNEKVAGLELLMEKMSDSIIAMELDRNVNLDRVGERLPGAQVYAFLGLSSTGKTELAKVMAETLMGSRENVMEVEANHLQTERHWDKYFGIDNSNPDNRTEFQKNYDRFNGRMVVILDELANVSDKSLLRKLYPYLRESEVAGRKLANVLFIVTGNTGQEIFQGIPHEVPEQERFFAEQEIYKKFLRNERLQEQFLYRDFPEPLVKRIGMERTFFFPPLIHKAIKKLFQIKIKQAFAYELSQHKEKQWWDIKFSDKDNFDKLLNKMADEGFRQDGQGDSVNRYVTKTFAQKLRTFLVKNRVSNGEEVVISLDIKRTEEALKAASDVHAEEKLQDAKGVYINVEVPSRNETLSFFMPGKAYDRPIKETKVNRVLTGYHESGHEIVGRVLMGDLNKSTRVSIIPGVAEINGEYVYYAGVREGAAVLDGEHTKEYILYKLAGLLGGTVAEELVSKGDRSRAGKHNDISRVNEIIRRAILEFGLSRMGDFAMPAGEKIEAFEEKVKQSDRGKEYREEFDWFLNEARKLAKESILLNWEPFVEIAKEALKRGELEGKDLDKIYEKHDVVDHLDPRFKRGQHAIRTENYAFDAEKGVRPISTFEKVSRYVSNKLESFKEKSVLDSNNRGVELIDKSLMPADAEIIDTQEIIKERIAKERSEVEIMEGLPFKTEQAEKRMSTQRNEVVSDAFQRKLCANFFK